MTQVEAKGHLIHSRSSYTSIQIELFTTDYRPERMYANGVPYDGWLEDVSIYARTDSLEQIKQAKLDALKKKCEDQTLYRGPEFSRRTTAYNVGSYEMESKFENVTGHAALSDDTPDDPEANDYKGTVYWTYHKVNPDGTTQVDGIKADSEYDFKSYEPDTTGWKISARTIKSSAYIPTSTTPPDAASKINDTRCANTARFHCIIGWRQAVQFRQ